MFKEETSDFLPLQEAKQYCNHSADYLKLRARQGKLKAIKIGRNWATKKEWIEEYLKNTEEYKKSIREDHPSLTVIKPQTFGLALPLVILIALLIAGSSFAFPGRFGMNEPLEMHTLQSVYRGLDNYIQSVAEGADFAVKIQRQSIENGLADFNAVSKKVSIFYNFPAKENFINTDSANLIATINPFFKTAGENTEKKVDIFEKQNIKAQTIETKYIQLRDKETGKLHCAWIENGKWMEASGGCDLTNEQ